MPVLQYSRREKIFFGRFMKKFFIVCLFYTLFQFPFFAAEKLVNFTVGLGSGIPFYGKIEGEFSEFDDISTQNKIVLDSFANLNFNLINQARFFVGIDLFTDFAWKNDDYKNFLHLCFPVGFRFYPNLGGLNLGVAYALGFRANFYKADSYPKRNTSSSWGNGFKFFFEYDFAYSSEHKWLPAIGCSWTFMPRGKYSYDNLLNFYISENF